MLINLGTNLKETNNLGETPLELAKKNINNEAYYILKEVYDNESLNQNNEQTESLLENLAITIGNSICWGFEQSKTSINFGYEFTKKKIIEAFTPYNKKEFKNAGIQTFEEELKIESLGAQTYNDIENILEFNEIPEDIKVFQSEPTNKVTYYDLIMNSVKNIEKNFNTCKRYEDILLPNEDEDCKDTYKDYNEDFYDDAQLNKVLKLNQKTKRRKTNKQVYKKCLVSNNPKDPYFSDTETLKQKEILITRFSAELEEYDNVQDISFRSLSEVSGEIKGRLIWNKKNHKRKSSSYY